MIGTFELKEEPMKREIIVGRMYRHFKGNKYFVIYIGEHTETGEEMVVYQAQNMPGKIWIRPLDMFNSEVDHEKYPEVKQKYRFELIE